MLFYYLTTSSSPFFTHLFGVTAFAYLPIEHPPEFSGRFYTLEIPLLVLQVLVQLPLALLMISGMKRVFRRPNSPAWSKSDVLGFCGFLFFMITGFFMADYIHIDEILAGDAMARIYIRSREAFIEREAYQYAFLFLAAGFLVGAFCTPSYFKRSRYVVLQRRGLLPRRAWFDDGASSLATILVYALVGGTFFVPYLMAGYCTLARGLTSFFLLGSYVLGFAGFLEFYRLGRFRRNKIFLITVMLVWWAFLPWMFFLIMDTHANGWNTIGSMSPLFGLVFAGGLVTGQESVQYDALIVPCCIAFLAWFFAAQEHAAVERNSGG